jgi:hypothetical protein
MTAQNQKPFEQQVRDAAARAEEELHRFVQYLDSEVVPEVRRNSSTALRAAAIRLQKLADSMDDARSKANTESAERPTSGPNPPRTGC